MIFGGVIETIYFGSFSNQGHSAGGKNVGEVFLIAFVLFWMKAPQIIMWNNRIGLFEQ